MFRVSFSRWWTFVYVVSRDACFLTDNVPYCGGVCVQHSAPPERPGLPGGRLEPLITRLDRQVGRYSTSIGMVDQHFAEYLPPPPRAMLMDKICLGVETGHVK
jgi:hypothetical protein